MADDEKHTARSIEALAEDLCEMDATMADAIGDYPADRFPSWSKSDEKRRDYWRQRAREMVAAGQAEIVQ